MQPLLVLFQAVSVIRLSLLPVMGVDNDKAICSGSASHVDTSKNGGGIAAGRG